MQSIQKFIEIVKAQVPHCDKMAYKIRAKKAKAVRDNKLTAVLRIARQEETKKPLLEPHTPPQIFNNISKFPKYSFDILSTEITGLPQEFIRELHTAARGKSSRRIS